MCAAIHETSRITNIDVIKGANPQLTSRRDSNKSQELAPPYSIENNKETSSSNQGLPIITNPNLYTFFNNIIYINNKRFYPYLVPKSPVGSQAFNLPHNEYNRINLLQSRDYVQGYFIIAMDHMYPNSTKKSPIFTAFPTYLEAFHWIRSLPTEQRCCYEVIPTEFADDITHIKDEDLVSDESIYSHPTVQKPHFDIDVDMQKDDENFKSFDNPSDAIITLGNDTKDALIAGIQHVMFSHDVPYEKSKHLLGYSSHRKDKRSYHIGIIGFYHNSPKEAAAFYKLVIGHIPQHLRKYVDHSVYKINQQFRILGNHKLGKDNIKTIDPITEWFPLNEYGNPCKDIRNIDPVTIWSSEDYDDKISLLGHFEASLITFTAGCVQLPSFITNVIVKPLIPENKVNVVTTWLASKNITLDTTNKRIIPVVSDNKYLDCNEYYNEIVDIFQKSQFYNHYDIGGIKNGCLILRRKHPSLCPIHNRVHDHDNSFIFITKTGSIYWRCSRSQDKDKSFYLGQG